MWRGAAFLVGALFVVSGEASAQAPTERPTPPQAVEGWTPTTPQLTQSGRTQPDGRQVVDPWQPYAPVSPGITAGQFRIYPSVTAAAFYDDNVFATSSNRQGSWGGIVRPELGVTTAGQNYAVEARGFLEKRWYSRFSGEDQLNGAAGVAGVAMLDPDRSSSARRATRARTRTAAPANPN